ncbi:hypothetical protein GOV12_00455 [Candidatus Pacearchaeota archaeon]|nr:hypothetical protein [Candidatus Pacearchaeota archaeon]
MRIKALEVEIDMRFELQKKDLKAAEERLRRMYLNDKKHGYDKTGGVRKSFNFYRSGGISYGGVGRKTSEGHIYKVGVDFIPSVQLIWEVMEHEKHNIEGETGLYFRNLSMEITPSGLRVFTGQWKYGEGSRLQGKNGRPEKEYTVELNFWGNPNRSQSKELRSLVDKLYLPRKIPQKGGGVMWETTTEHSGRGGSMPTVILRKGFVGDIDRSAEKQIQVFYDSILQVVLDNNIIDGFVHPGINKTLGELELERTGTDLHEHIANSSVGIQSFYAPQTRITAIQSTGNNKRPELRWKKNKYVRENREEIMILTAFSDVVMLPGDEEDDD